MIKKLTKKQEAKIPEYIKKWVDLASRPIDRTKAFEVTTELFKEEKPKILFAESIKQAKDMIKDMFGKKTTWTKYISYYLYDWAGYYDYAKMIGVNFDENDLGKYFDILLNMPICVFAENTVFIVEKPKCTWENSRLHSEINPAISWEDGTGIYFLRGVRLEKDLWEKIIKKQLSFKECMGLKNIEQRMIALKYMNAEELLKHTNNKLLDKSDRGNELYVIEELFSEKAYFLKYSCPSTGRVYISGIDPQVGQQGNADLGMAWKFKISLDEYRSLKNES